MKYAMLIYTGEAQEVTATPEELRAMYASYGGFTAEVHEKKVYLGGEALKPTTTATTVRVRDGKTTVTDGPFAETREQLGGFYLLDCKDLDEAIEYAAKIPGASVGSVEVRPVFVWE